MTDTMGVPIVYGTQRPLEPSAGPPRQDDEISALVVVNRILARRRLVLALALAAFAFTAVTGLTRKRTWSATASFMPQTRRQQPAGLAGLAAQLGVSVGGGEGTQSPAFYADLVRARQVVGAVVESTYTVVVDGAPRRQRLEMLLEGNASSAAQRRDRAIRKLTRSITANAHQKTGVVTLSVAASTPALAKQIADRILAEVNRFNLETRQSQAAAERRFTEARLAEARAELRRAEDRLERFLQTNRAYLTSPDLAFQQDRLAREVTQRQQVMLALAQAYEQARIDEVRDTPVITLIERPEVPVQPNPRGLIRRGLMSLLAGAFTGILLAVVPLFFGRRADSDPLHDFHRLRRETLRDLRNPLRLLRPGSETPTQASMR